MKNNENNNRVNFEIDTTNYTFIPLKELPLNSMLRKSSNKRPFEKVA